MFKNKQRFLVDYLVGIFLKKGNRLKAKKIIRNLFTLLFLESRKSPLMFLYCAVGELRPFFGLKPLKVGRNVYRVPFPISALSSYKRGVRYLMQGVKERPEKGIVFRLRGEIRDLILNRRGCSIKYVLYDYQIGFESRDFSHYRWK